MITPIATAPLPQGESTLRTLRASPIFSRLGPNDLAAMGWAQKEIAAAMGRTRWCIHSHIDQACRLLELPVDQRKVTLWLYGMEGKDD